MKVEYDPKIDAAYIYFDQSMTAEATNTYACDPDEVGGQIQLDFDKSGRLIGIEVLDVSHMLPAAVLRTGVGSE